MLKFKSPYDETEYEAAIKTDEYLEEKLDDGTHRLCASLYIYEPEYDCWEPWCNITKNIRAELTDKDCGFVDTNDAPYITHFLLVNGLGKPTGRYGESGFCIYPEFRFDRKRLEEESVYE